MNLYRPYISITLLTAIAAATGVHCPCLFTFTGELCIHLNDLQTAEDIFTALIDRNTENVK